MEITSISAVTLATHDMGRAVRFYRALGFVMRYGGETAQFTSFIAGSTHLSLVVAAPEARWSWWGRVIFYVRDVDATHRRALASGYAPETSPADAGWGERYFHILDPDGHELSFAKPLRG
ncbi:MAG: VOC family protein [Dehalococcoidia bacterium]